ncbi:MAG: superoxide dismutase [Lachnospiraceae bacterium]|nr:superoxide dismutase [Lachnospiraceae bacterium]
MEKEHYPFKNTPLPYAYDALEPYIDAKTMELHHNRHLQTYIDNLNNTLKDYPMLQNASLVELIYNAGRLPKEIQMPVRNNAGGVYNHRFYFDNMINSGNSIPIGNLKEAIDSQFGSFENFKSEFKKAALSIFGSGYAWLVADKGQLKIITTPNQNNPIEQNMCPVLNIDVWEHAYYLKHYNLRAEYIDDLFNVINWEKAEENYNNCVK